MVMHSVGGHYAMTDRAPSCPHADATHLWDRCKAFAGPIGSCRCCGLAFGYIDSGTWSDEYEEIIANDPTLCPPCGGRPTIRRKGNRPSSRVGRFNESTRQTEWEDIPGGHVDYFEPGTATHNGEGPT